MMNNFKALNNYVFMMYDFKKMVTSKTRQLNKTLTIVVINFHPFND